METGSPQTPGHEPDYGQTMKPKEPTDLKDPDRDPPPQWPQAREAQPEPAEQERDADLDIDR